MVTNTGNGRIYAYFHGGGELKFTFPDKRTDYRKVMSYAISKLGNSRYDSVHFITRGKQYLFYQDNNGWHLQSVHKVGA
jgi:hypothetical protein